MEDDAIEKLNKRIKQAIEILDKLIDENSNLKAKITTMEDEIYRLRDEIRIFREERELIKTKIDSVILMLDKLNMGEER